MTQAAVILFRIQMQREIWNISKLGQQSELRMRKLPGQLKYILN